jgi:ribose transport system permease protein
MFSRFTTDYGMLFVLLLLCGYYSWATWAEQHPTGAAAGEQVAQTIAGQLGPKARVLIVAGSSPEDGEFVQAARAQLSNHGLDVAAAAQGSPSDALETMRRLGAEAGRLDAFACSAVSAGWPIYDKVPALAGARVVAPRSYAWPNFLKASNLLNVANQIVVIAIIAIGMTMVIITGGIDLAVGSLIALSAVTAALVIRALGGQQASTAAMVFGGLAGILICAVAGLLSGAVITWFRIPAFIMTLAMMLIARGAAEILADNQSIPDVPARFVWLGRGADLLGIPNAVVLMIVLYLVAHILMSRMTLGRYIYAVGGNEEAARLSGVPVRGVLLFVYTVCGAAAGLGGVILASLLKSGAPTYGQEYELYVIAAVVVGGTSLQGGRGRIFGTLIGAFIIAVMKNGMNLTGVDSNWQRVVLGLVILGAVLLDQLKHADWRKWLRRRAGPDDQAPPAIGESSVTTSPSFKATASDG